MIPSFASLSRVRSGLTVLRRSALAQSVAGLSGITVAEMAIGLATAVVLGRELGAEGLGIYSLAIAAATLAGLPVEFGLPGLVMREVALAGPNGAAEKGIILFAASVILATSMIVVPLLLVAGHLSALGLGDTTRAILPLAALLIPVRALGKALGAAVAGRHRVALGSVPQRLVRPGAFALALVALAATTPGWLTPERAVLLQLGASALALGLGLALFLVYFTGTMRTRHATIMWRPWLAATLRLGVSHGMMQAQPQLLLLLTGLLASVEEVGLFRIAQRAAELVAGGAAIVRNAAAPRIASLHAGEELARLQRLVTFLARVSFGLALAGLAVYVVAGQWLLTLLFGSGFPAAWGPMVILTLGISLQAFCGPGALLMNMLRRESVTMIGFAISLGISVLLAAALISPFGAAGAAWATVFGQIVMGVFLLHRAWRELGVEVSAIGVSLRRG